MKITKTYLRQMIKEELGALEEYGSNWEAGASEGDSIAPGDPAKAKVLAIASMLQGLENNKSFGFDPKVSQKIITDIRDILGDASPESETGETVATPAPGEPPQIPLGILGAASKGRWEAIERALAVKRKWEKDNE